MQRLFPSRFGWAASTRRANVQCCGEGDYRSRGYQANQTAAECGSEIFRGYPTIIYRCHLSRCSGKSSPYPAEFPKMPGHTIRLNSQWLPQNAPRHPPPDSYFRLPASPTPEIFLHKQPFIIQRHFHAPTGVTEQTTVRLRLDLVAATASVALNGHPLAADPPAQTPLLQAPATWSFPLTSLLQPFNSLVVTLTADASANPQQLPTLVAAGLVIDEPNSGV